MDKKEPHIFTASEFFQLTSEILGIQTSQNEKMTYARAFDTQSDRFAGKEVDDEEKSDGICEKIIQTLLGEDCFLKNEQVNLDICREILHTRFDAYEEYFGLLQSSFIYQNTNTQSLNKTLIRLLLTPLLALLFMELQNDSPDSCSLKYLMTCIEHIYKIEDEDIVVTCKKILREKVETLTRPEANPSKKYIHGDFPFFKHISSIDSRSKTTPSKIKELINELENDLRHFCIPHNKSALSELRGLYNCMMILMRVKQEMEPDTFNIAIRQFNLFLILMDAKYSNPIMDKICDDFSELQINITHAIFDLNYHLLKLSKENRRTKYHYAKDLEEKSIDTFKKILYLPFTQEFRPNQESKELIDYTSKGLAVIKLKVEQTESQALISHTAYFTRLIKELHTLEHLNYSRPVKAFTQCILAMIENQYEESLHYIDTAYDVRQSGHIGIFLGYINQFKLCLMLSKKINLAPNVIAPYITGLSSNSNINSDFIIEGVHPEKFDYNQFLRTANYGLTKMITNYNKFCINLEVNPNQFIVNPLTKIEEFFDSFFYEVDQSKEINFEKKVMMIHNKFKKNSLDKYKVYQLKTSLIEWIKPLFPVTFGIESRYEYKGETIDINPNILRYYSLEREEKQAIINMLESIYSS